ncbi:MAG: aromatic ring-hydroxylating dioxygenase subunit alpha [Pseudomonadota bacterium]|nr:aromatic ring-hydroxylating dioxygenase subunit alpha [Pseudomonadota bacterium]
MNAPIIPTDALPVWPANLNEIPKEIWEREDVYQLELERIYYGPFWHVVAHTAEIPNPGDYKTFFLGERPIIVARGDDGQVRVFYNACTHRATLLETSAMGNKSEFECPYHRWLFNNRGELVGCPAEEDYTVDFQKGDFNLLQIRTAEYAGVIFATASDETPDLDTFLGESKPYIDKILGKDGDLELLGYQKVLYNSNWKAYFDNDGFHAPLLHKAFRMLNWQGGKGRQFATGPGHIVFVSQLTVPSNPEFLKDPSIVSFKGTDPNEGSVLVALMPITGIIKHLDMINIRFAFPAGLYGTEVHYASFARKDDDPEMARHRMRQGANLIGPSGLVSMEDAAIFSRIQQGSRTPGYAIFQKGVKDKRNVWHDYKQNDETGNLPKWEVYREVMGFQRSAG